MLHKVLPMALLLCSNFLPAQSTLRAKTPTDRLYCCMDMMPGGGGLDRRLQISFDRSLPAYGIQDEQTSAYCPNTPSLVSALPFLSPTSICGMNLDFKKDCTSEESLNEKGYVFSFRCGDKRWGSFECDNDCLNNKTSGVSLFKCGGPGVDPIYTEPGIDSNRCVWW
jgi:hypothetical protein